VLVDHRTYRFRPGTLPAHLDIYEKNGFAAQTRHLGQPVAYMFAESGELNTLVHIWAYEDAADRARRRAAMQADPDWKAYLKKSGEAGYLVDQKTSLMIPAGFAPIKR
jgi:NIPSNAP